MVGHQFLLLWIVLCGVVTVHSQLQQNTLNVLDEINNDYGLYEDAPEISNQIKSRVARLVPPENSNKAPTTDLWRGAQLQAQINQNRRQREGTLRTIEQAARNKAHQEVKNTLAALARGEAELARKYRPSPAHEQVQQAQPKFAHSHNSKEAVSARINAEEVSRIRGHRSNNFPSSIPSAPIIRVGTVPLHPPINSHY